MASSLGNLSIGVFYAEFRALKFIANSEIAILTGNIISLH